MKTLSLYAKLRNLHRTGILSLKFNPDLLHVYSGEGSYYYEDNPIEVVPDVTGKGPQGQYFSEPHDVAWVPATGTFLAASPSKPEPFQLIPPELRKLVSNFRAKSAS